MTKEIRPRHYKHGKSHNVKKKCPLYNRYNAIKNSCYNPNSKSYYVNGARGIVMCDLWKNDFMEFYNWSIKNGFTNTRAIHRIDRNAEFGPNNCKWISKLNKHKLTNANKPPINRVKVDYEGKIYSINELKDLLNVSYSTLYRKLRNPKKLSGKTISYKEIRLKVKNNLNKL